jgi:hypothetical protein
MLAVVPTLPTIMNRLVKSSRSSQQPLSGSEGHWRSG